MSDDGVIGLLTEAFANPYVAHRAIGLNDDHASVSHGVAIDAEVFEGEAIIGDHGSVDVGKQPKFDAVLFCERTVGER